jgi:hypothetical protein
VIPRDQLEEIQKGADMNAFRLIAIQSILCLGLLAEQGGASIDGAFGMKFGEVFDKTKSTGKRSLTSGEAVWQFAPSKPFKWFQSYFVLLTPKTGKIYAIWGKGQELESAVVDDQAKVLLAILGKKYGVEGKRMLFSSGTKTIEKGGKTIILKQDGFLKKSLEIRYIHDSLSKQAEKERVELESSKLDDSGL